VNKGYALGKLKRYEEECACYDRALKIYPYYFAALTHKPVALIHLKRYREALTLLDKVLEIAPKNAKALYRKGLSLAKLGRHEDAIGCLTDALELNSTIADAWVVLSNSYFFTGNLEASARAFDQAYYIDIHDIREGLVKGLGLLKSGNVDEGIRCFSEVLGIFAR
jgi:tetratricopeptide (TPR) repeat protein